jgi:hypothetical protein
MTEIWRNSEIALEQLSKEKQDEIEKIVEEVTQ